MRLVEKLKEYENQYMFIRWATGGEYVHGWGFHAGVSGK